MVALYDAMLAVEWLTQRCAGVSLERFAADETLQAAVERKLEVIGEALSRAERADSTLVERVPDLRKVIGLRNVLAHGYDVIDSREIHLIVTTRVPELAMNLRELPGMKGVE